MGFLRSSSRFVRGQAAGMVHAYEVRAWGGMLRGMIHTLKMRSAHPLCPSCGEGRLFPMGVINEVDCNHLLGCSRCAFYCEAAKAERDMASAARARMAAMSPVKLQHIIRRHAMVSRCCYALAFVFLVLDVVALLSGSSLQVLCFSAGGFAALSRGLVGAFRCWQLRTQRFYEQGLFKAWLGAGEWLV
jgi:hypothetical protein